MELPLGGPALRHYTQSRPRPHRQKLNYRPTKIQEPIIECENEDFELMGRVDEGVEEFFTKKVLPTETLKKEDEEEEEETITVHEVAPASTVPCPPPTKTLRRKLGDFFTLKKRRGLKSEPSQEGRPKKTSIADFIRPLREVARGEKDKDKDKVKENDKGNEKEKPKEGTDTGDAVQGISISDAPPMRGEAVPPRRALREGKSQSLILLSGSSSGASRNKKLDSQNSFEQKLHLMLQRIGVSKPQERGETQNQEGEMKKAESEGTIIDNKQDPPSTKPRTMSASSDTRHQLRSSVSAHESAGKPPLLPKPVIKPAPPATISGSITPENELDQTDGQPNPEAAVSTSSTPIVATISDTAPDSATVLPSSTAVLADTHVCTDITVEAKAPADVSEQDRTVIPEASSSVTEAPSPTKEKALTSTATPATPSPEPNALDVIERPNSTVNTLPTCTMENSSASDNNTITATDMSSELTSPEPDATVINAAPTSTSISSLPASQSIDVVTANDDSTPCTLPTTQGDSDTISQENKMASEKPSFSESVGTVTSTITAETCVATTVPSCALPETSSAICTAAKTETPAFTTCTTSTLASSLIIAVTPALTPVTSTESSQTTTVSPAIFPLAADAELPLSAAVHSAPGDGSTTEFENVPSVHLTTSDLTETHSGLEHVLQTSDAPEEIVIESSVKVTAEIEDVVKEIEETKPTEDSEQSESSKGSEKKTDEPTVVSSEVIEQDTEEKPKEDILKINDIAEAELEEKDTSDELCRDEIINGDQTQHEIKDFVEE